MRTVEKIAVLVICLIANSGKVGAQGLGIELNGGLQGMQYKLSGGQSSLLPGGSLGLTYTFRISGGWGIRTGILGSVYRTQASLKDGTYTNGQVDDVGSAFMYNVKVAGYKETQQFFAATIPLLLHYHSGGPGVQWYFDGGGKLLFPFNSSIQASASQLSLSGYYPNFHIMVSNLPKHGFGAVNGWHDGSSAELKPAGVLSAGTGVSFAVSRTTRLYAGVYVDYGLTDLRQRRDSLPLVTYSSAGIDNVKANGVMNMPNTGAATLLSFGVQLRLSFGSSRTKAADRPKEVVAPVQTQSMSAKKDSMVPMDPNRQTPPVATATTAATVDSHAATVDSHAATADTHVARVDSQVAASDELSLDSLIQEDELRAARRSAVERTRRNVVFGIIGETTIPETQKAKLDELVGLLNGHLDLRISIEGHFCDSLMEMENSQTAAARTKAVVRYLENKGISRRRMDISNARESDAVLSYDPAANYRNRRVAIRIIGSF